MSTSIQRERWALIWVLVLLVLAGIGLTGLVIYADIRAALQGMYLPAIFSGSFVLILTPPMYWACRS